MRLPRPGGDALGGQLDHGVEVGSVEVGVGSRPAHQREEPVLVPFLGRRHLGHDLLGQDVERGHGGQDGVEASGAHGGQEGGALHQLVAGHGEEDPLGDAAAGVVGAAHPLEEGGDGAWRPDLADELHGADVDAELERRRGHEGPEVAGRAGGPRRAVRRSLDRLPWWAATCSGPRRSPRRWARRSDSRRVLTNTSVVRWPVTWSAMRSTTSPNCSVEDTAASSARAARCGPGGVAAWPQSTMARRRGGHPLPGSSGAAVLLDGALGGRQADALGPAGRLEVLETLEGEGQVRAPLVPGQRVDLVHDHRRTRCRGRPGSAAAVTKR